MLEKPVLTVGEVLKRPLFKDARVQAGQHGLSRPIRWVHILETAENAYFLKGGELVLSTGAGFDQKRDHHLLFLEEVIRRRAAGLCIELGHSLPGIPPAMAALADGQGFPLIVFTSPVHFVDITMDLHEHLINLHNTALRQLEEYSRSLQKLTLETQSLPRTLLHFQSMAQSQVFLYSLDQPSFYAPQMPQARQQEVRKKLSDFLASQKALPRAPGLLPLSPGRQILYQPILAMGNVLAYLCLITREQKGEEFLYLTLDYTANAIAQILLRSMFAREQAHSSESRLMEDILWKGADSSGRLQEALGLPGGSPACWAVLMEARREEEAPAREETGATFHDLLAVFRSLLNRRGFRPLMYSRGSRLYLLLLDRGDTARQDGRDKVAAALEAMEGSLREALGAGASVLMGVSRSPADYGAIRRAFAEAEQVLALGSGAAGPFFSDLGIERLFHSALNPAALKSFAADYLGPLLDYDQRHGTSLVQTLRVYLEKNLNKQETAAGLYIHRQTLYHRLGKIAAVLGEKYLENRLALEMAFHIRDYLEQPGLAGGR
jgi:PucR family transcriptional regulator, purine catabolism regulatory protein